MKKNHEIRIKVSQQELELIKRKAELTHLSLSAYARYLLLNTHLKIVMEE